MVSTRSRAAVASTPMASLKSGPKLSDTSPVPISTPPVNHEAYERSREERIRANLEKMQKLGIIDLGLKLKAEKRVLSVKRDLKSPQVGRKSLQQRPSRRSSRLQGVASVSYSELRGKVEALDEDGGRVRVVSDDENVQVVKGRVIYDKINGKTCHQCRQKTLRTHTRCSNCVGVQGQFCGGCLRARYGEQIVEAIENPDWICPVCRGICNCSLCRTKHGKAPTGQIFYKVASLGFKSVAHYLIQKPAAPNSISSKRALTFSED